MLGAAVGHLDGWLYTHYRPYGNMPVLRQLARSIVVNLSADSLRDADRLSRHGLPVVVAVPADHPERSTTPEGRAVVVCPEQTGRAANCEACMLCARPNRRVIVGFRIH